MERYKPFTAEAQMSGSPIISARSPAYLMWTYLCVPLLDVTLRFLFSHVLFSTVLFVFLPYCVPSLSFCCCLLSVTHQPPALGHLNSLFNLIINDLNSRRGEKSCYVVCLCLWALSHSLSCYHRCCCRVRACPHTHTHTVKTGGIVTFHYQGSLSCTLSSV